MLHVHCVSHATDEFIRWIRYVERNRQWVMSHIYCMSNESCHTWIVWVMSHLYSSVECVMGRGNKTCHTCIVWVKSCHTCFVWAMCHVTHVWDESCHTWIHQMNTCVTWLIPYMCDMTHCSYKTCVTWLYSYNTCVTCLVAMCAHANSQWMSNVTRVSIWRMRHVAQAMSHVTRVIWRIGVCDTSHPRLIWYVYMQTADEWVMSHMYCMWARSHVAHALTTMSHMYLSDECVT